MDITTTPIQEVVSTYNRQEKLAEARKKAEARMIKTAVAERVTLSGDAHKLLNVLSPESNAKAEAVAHALPMHRRSSPVAKEYEKNQPFAEETVGAASEADEVSSEEGTALNQGRPGVAPPEELPSLPVFRLEIPKHIPQYSFPIPKELKAYISSLPLKERHPVPAP